MTVAVMFIVVLVMNDIAKALNRIGAALEEMSPQNQLMTEVIKKEYVKGANTDK